MSGIIGLKINSTVKGSIVYLIQKYRNTQMYLQ